MIGYDILASAATYSFVTTEYNFMYDNRICCGRSKKKVIFLKFKNDENLIFLKPWNFTPTPLRNFRKKLKLDCKTIWLPCRWLRSLTQ